MGGSFRILLMKIVRFSASACPNIFKFKRNASGHILDVLHALINLDISLPVLCTARNLTFNRAHISLDSSSQTLSSKILGCAHVFVFNSH